MKYKVKYRKTNSFFWKTLIVVGHIYNKEMNRMDFFLENGSMTSISNWNNYDFKLGIDWVAATKKKMSDEANQELRFTR